MLFSPVRTAAKTQAIPVAAARPFLKITLNLITNKVFHSLLTRQENQGEEAVRGLRVAQARQRLAVFLITRKGCQEAKAETEARAARPMAAEVVVAHTCTAAETVEMADRTMVGAVLTVPVAEVAEQRCGHLLTGKVVRQVLRHSNFCFRRISMAILHDGKYLKVDAKNISLEEGHLMVNYLTYRDETHRSKEKEREPLFEQFKYDAANYFADKNEELYTWLIGQGIDPAVHLSDEERDEILARDKSIKSMFEFCAKQSDELYGRIIPNFYGEHEPIKLKYTKLWKTLGFREEWLSDPIVTESRTIMDVGEYDGRVLTPLVMYKKIKPFLPGGEDC